MPRLNGIRENGRLGTDVKTAAQMYDQFVTTIDEAAASRSIYNVPRAAEREGLAGGKTHRSLGQGWEYSFVDDYGSSLNVQCRWYDQSKVFSIRFDMHVMTVGPPSYKQR